MCFDCVVNIVIDSVDNHGFINSEICGILGRQPIPVSHIFLIFFRIMFFAVDKFLKTTVSLTSSEESPMFSTPGLSPCIFFDF